MGSMRFDWTDLQLFVHACDAGSLTGAAQRAHLTLAAVSARIRGMEDRCGVALLERHARGVRPTPAGLALLRHARAVLAQLAALDLELDGHGRSAQPPLRLLANTSGMARLVAGPVARFLLAHPSAGVVAEESPSHATAQALREGKADAGILSDAVDLSGLAARPLCTDPLVLAVPPGHELAGRGDAAFAEALDHEWVGWTGQRAMQSHLEFQAARLGRDLRPRAGVGDAQGVLALVAAGAGVAVMPGALAGLHEPRGRHAAGAVAIVPLRDEWARRNLVLCTAADAPRDGPLEALCAKIVAFASAA